jgi:hypothetical protein
MDIINNNLIDKLQPDFNRIKHHYDYADARELLESFATQFNQTNSVITDEEIQAMAEKEYPVREIIDSDSDVEKEYKQMYEYAAYPLRDSFIKGAKAISEKLCSLIADISVKFYEWQKTESWKIEYATQENLTTESLFNYFIENIYKK